MDFFEAYLYQHFCCSARAAPPGEPGVLNEDLSAPGTSTNSLILTQIHLLTNPITN